MPIALPLAIQIPTLHPDHPILSWTLAILAVLILGIAKSGFGGGVGVLAVPMFALAMGAKLGTATLLPILIAADIFSVYHHWGTWDKHILRVLTPGSLVGIALGSIILYLLVTASPPPAATAPAVPASSLSTKSAKQQGDDALNLITGIVAVAYVGLDQIRARLAPNWHFKPNHRSGAVAGFSVGIISTISHAAGPIAAIFLLGQKLPRQTFIGTTVIYFFGINMLKLIPFFLIPGMMTLESLTIGLWLAPIVPLGTFLGAALNRRMSESVFRNTIMVIVCITGIQLIAETLSGVTLVGLVKSLL